MNSRSYWRAVVNRFVISTYRIGMYSSGRASQTATVVSWPPRLSP